MRDDLLMQSRRFPYSAKICDERLADYERECRGMIAKCKAEGRDFTKIECAQFDEIVDAAMAWKREKELAKQHRAVVLTYSRMQPRGALDPLFS